MKYLFYLGHPAHYHMFKHVIKKLNNGGHETVVLIKKKDILEELLKKDDVRYYNIYSKDRGKSRIATFYAMLEKDLNLFRIAYKEKPDLLLGTSVEITHVGRLLGIKSIIFNEDDYHYIKEFVILGYTFANYIVTPAKCETGNYITKNLRYDSYQKMAYLHPDIFTPDTNVVQNLGEKYFIIRRTKLSAYHDKGHFGLSDSILSRLIGVLQKYGEVYVSFESEDMGEFGKYRLPIPIHQIHHALAFSSFFISDSQSMSIEAAILGVPSIRFNDFAGKIAVLEELEHEYDLTWGIHSSDVAGLFEKVETVIKKLQGDHVYYRQNADRLVKAKINTTNYFHWFISNFPKSVIMQGDQVANMEFMEMIGFGN